MEHPSVPVLCDFTPQWGQQVATMEVSRANDVDSSATGTVIEVSTSLSCEQCQKDFKEVQAYQEHMVNFHSYVRPEPEVEATETEAVVKTKKPESSESAGTENGTSTSSEIWGEGDIFTDKNSTVSSMSTLADGTVEVQVTADLEDEPPASRRKRMPRPKPEKTMVVIKKKKKKPNLLRKLLEEPDDSFETKALTADGEVIDVGSDEERKNRLLKKGKPVVAQAREMANNVVEYFRREAKRNKFILPPTNWLKRAALATGVSVNCLLAIRKEKKETGTFSTPGLHRQRKSTITNLTDNEMKLIKDEMKRVCQEGLAVTVDRMMPFAREHTTFRGGRTSLWRIMKTATKRKPRKKKESEEKNDEGAVQPPKEKKARTANYGEQVVETENQTVMIQQPQTTYTMRTDNSMPLASAEALLMLTQQNNAPPPTTMYQQQYEQPPTTSRPNNILSGLVTYQPSNQHATGTTHMNLVAPGGLQDPITIQLELPSMLSAAGIMSHGQTAAQYHAPQYMRPSQQE